MRIASEAVKLFLNTKSFTATKFNSPAFTRARMSTSSNEVSLREIFHGAVHSVRPKTLFRRENFQIVGEKVQDERVVCKFNDIEVSIDIGDGGKQCHLVGFGKGVYGMAEAVSNVLGKRLKSGILSVPFGTVDQFPHVKLDNIEVFEGARNNLPDDSAAATANKIVDFIGRLSESDVLFVLITGGGSALLPLPCDGVTLDEKCTVVKQLAGKGADINDINRVRIDLSRTKGGKLVAQAERVGAVITFIISDIIDDPIHLIASGPTVIPVKADECTSRMVLEKYSLWHTLPEHIQETIVRNSQLKLMPSPKVTNLIIANNETAITAAIENSNAQNVPAVILSTRIDGTVRVVNEAYIKLAIAVRQLQRKAINVEDFRVSLKSLERVLRLRPQFAENLVQVMATNDATSNGFRLIAGGEPTVEISGCGIGGRNQELALRFSRSCYVNELLHDVQLLSAGTDGIDGPTTAAGAIGSAQVVQDFLKMSETKNLSQIDDFVQNNDSFNFYASLLQGKYHVITGHTGTNVMDLHILHFPALGNTKQ